jgi:hypothetical protein
MRLLLGLLALAGFAAAARADDVSLLRQVAQSWLDERDRWAFTQHVREYDGQVLKEERVERYDPSDGYERRWRLISINGRKPTPEQWEAWNRRKNKKPRRNQADIEENFDFAHAKLIEETPTTARYELPLKNGVEWLFPINKVELLITIDKSGPSLKQVQARINEPFRVALGLARILDIDLDLVMKPPPQPDPAAAQPGGTAEAVVTKFGDRVEYSWSEFERVGPSKLERYRADAAK